MTESKIIDVGEEYVLLDIDRDPGIYEKRLGRGMWFIELHKEPMLITSVDVEKRELTCDNGDVIRLGANKPSEMMFTFCYGRAWDRTRHVFVDDEDFTDYRPGFYKSIGGPMTFWDNGGWLEPLMRDMPIHPEPVLAS